MPFASMTQDDVAAFYELLDEYFESRKELFASWVNPNGSTGTTSHSNAPVHAPAPVAPPTSARMTAPPPPISRASPAPPPPVPAAASYVDTASAKPAKPQPSNKYGVTIPSMSDFKDPKFQQGFKFAGSAASAAGGLINKHVMGNAPRSPEPAGAAGGSAPPPASKPSGLAGKAMSFAQNKMMAPPAAPNAATNTSVPLPPPSPASRGSGSGRGIGSVTAQYDYSSAESGDLSFKQGDSITLLAKESADWWKGEFRGRQGLFPASYVSED